MFWGQSLYGHSSGIDSVTFDASEGLVAAGAASGTIKLWDLEEAKGKFSSSLIFLIYSSHSVLSATRCGPHPALILTEYVIFCCIYE